MNNKLSKKKDKEKRLKKRRAEKQKKRTKKAAPLLPILCRPGAEMSSVLYIIGWIMRSLVLFCGVFGLTLFVGDGFGIYGAGKPGSIPALALTALCLTVVCSAAAWNSRTRIIAPLCGIAAGAGALFMFSSNPIQLLWDGIRCILNTAMLHMADIGYTSFADNLIGSRSYCASDAVVMGTGCAVLATVIAVILAFSLLKKVHAFSAVLLSIVIILPVFMYNLTEGNAGVSMVLIFIFGELSLLVYEKKFSNYEARKVEKKEKKAAKKLAKKEKKQAKKDKKNALDRTALRAYAIALELTGDNKEARKAKSAVYELERKKKNDLKKAAKLSKKEEKKKARAEKKALRKERAAEKKARKAAAAKEKAQFKNLSPEEQSHRLALKKADKEARLAEIKEKKRRRAENETVARKILSASGYAGGTAVIAAALAVWIPFSVITGNFVTIDFINDPVSVVREYVTAYLRGDDIDLNNMGDVAELTPRTLTYDSPKYKGVQMLAVETERADPVYLRGWIGMRFDPKTGTWTSGTTDDVVEYRNQFGKSFSPDSLKTYFMGKNLPTSTSITEKNTALRFSNFGFDVRQVHLRRINGESLIVYLPPTMNSDLGILGYNSIVKHDAKYSAYFDAIYSSRFFNRDVNYSAVSFMSKLNDVDAAKNLTGISKYFSLYMKYIEIYDGAKHVLESTGFDGTREYDTGHGKVNISTDDYSDIDRLFLEECRRLGYPEFTGDSLVAKYIKMSPKEQEKEKEALAEFTATEEEYREWANLKYGGSTYSYAVGDIAKALLDEAGFVRNERVSDPVPVYNNIRGIEVNQHDVVMTVIDYLRDNYTYTLEPTPYEGETELTVLDSFLTETKNGYCTHFATAAAAILREYGYSVRYCEGYLVTDFDYNRSDEAPAKYIGYALDENAHAWVEVYYPMQGWVAYETVPKYMEQMYDPNQITEGNGGVIVDPNPDVPKEEIIPEPEKPEEPEKKPEPPKAEEPGEDVQTEEEREDEQMMILIIIGITVAAAALIFFILRLIVKRIIKKAEHAVEDRHRHIITAMDTELLMTSKIDTHPIAKEFDDTIFRIFGLIGYGPRTGEQYSEYAERLEADFGGMTDYSLSQVFDLVAKTEFGGGLTPEEMYILADFTDRLTVSAYAGLSLFEKIKYRYLKRII